MMMKLSTHFFDRQSIILQSTATNDEDLDTINSQIKYDILDISQANINHEILTIDKPKSEEIELRSLLSLWNLEVLADECIGI